MFYPGETVRLLQEVPEHALPKYMEGRVVSVLCNENSESNAAEIEFYGDPRPVTVRVPVGEIEPVISRAAQDRTAVFWGLDGPPEKLVEAAMHSILDSGFLMRDGLNVARLYYDREERWWKWGEKIIDPTGAQMVASAGAWDGCIAAFSGQQRFHLELRLQGRREAVVMLHEHDSVFIEQARTTHAAMSLARVLMNLGAAVGARYCAFPVATPWLFDEDWQSLLRPPLYPDFFLLPDADPPLEVPESFRTIKLTGKRTMLTVLPVKSAPSDPGTKRSDRELELDRLRRCKALGEKYYDQMYETQLGASGLYSSAKDAFYDAIAAANSLGLKEEAEDLQKRLDHIKAVFRSQFS